jgi:hypothetical protein
MKPDQRSAGPALRSRRIDSSGGGFGGVWVGEKCLENFLPLQGRWRRPERFSWEETEGVTQEGAARTSASVEIAVGELCISGFLIPATGLGFSL